MSHCELERLKIKQSLQNKTLKQAEAAVRLGISVRQVKRVLRRYREHKVIPYRRLASGEAPIPLDDEKSIHRTLDQAKRNQAARPNYKPAPDHPWRKGAAEKERSADAILP